MALSSKLNDPKTPEEIGDELDALGKLIDRTKVMYEQYFMGIQKMPPSQLHRDVERRIREITQLHIRNTGLRFRFATLTQKFGSYNTYWKRTMRKIERGEYIRDVVKASRNARRRGVDVPDEVLAKVPARMRKRILRDRERMASRAAKDEANRPAAKQSQTPGNVHTLSTDDDLDLDSIFASLTSEEPSAATPAPSAASEFAESPGSYQQVRRGEAKDASPSDEARKMPPLPQRPPARRVAAPPPPAAAAPAAKPKVTPPPGMSEREGRALFEKYSKARKLVGDRRPVSYEQLMKKLGKQAPKIMKDYNASGVGFNVVIKGDKVILKAKPQKSPKK